MHLGVNPFATVESRNRLYLIAQGSATQHLRLTSMDDMLEWNSWSDMPQPPGIPPATPTAIAGVSLDGTLHVFIVDPLASDVRKLLPGHTTTAWFYTLRRQDTFSCLRRSTILRSINSPWAKR